MKLTELTRQELEALTVEITTENAQLKTQLAWYEEQFRLSRAQRFGASSEKTTAQQLSFFNEAEAESDEEKAEPQMSDVRVHEGRKKKKKGHKERLVSRLAREVIEYTLTEEEQVCPACGSRLHEMTKEIRKELVLIPAKVKVVEHVKHVYGCRQCETTGTEGTIIKAEAPKGIFRNSLASASMLADILTKKYMQAQPLYRQEEELKRKGCAISRQTLANWVVNTAETYLSPMYDLLHEELLQKDVIHADETTVEVLKEPGRSANTDSFMWLYRSSGCDAKQPVVLYEYQESRSGEHPKKFLEGFKGYLQTDGYSGYNKVADRRGSREAEVIPVGCMAHCRRKYNEAMKVIPKGVDKNAGFAAKGLSYCNKLFAIEREAEKGGLTYGQRYELRKEKAEPIFDEFMSWAEKASHTALEKSKLNEALTYTLNQQQPLRNYLLDGRLEISNNRAERSIKPFVIGRKNWLFSNTPKGAWASAVCYSLIETAKEAGLDVFEYLKYLLETMSQMESPQPDALRQLLPYSDHLPQRCRLQENDT